LNDDGFVEFSVSDISNKKIFSQVLKSEEDNNDIIITDDFSSINKD